MTRGGLTPGTAVLRWRGVLVVLVTANLVWHTVALALPGGTLSACLPAFGNLARAGVQLAALTMPGGCAEAASTDTGRIALAALLTAVPLLGAHLAATVTGAAAVVVLRRLERVVRDVLQLVVRHLPVAVGLPAGGRLATAERHRRESLPASLIPPPINRRGPPVARPA